MSVPFIFGKRSERNLIGVDPRMVQSARRALTTCPVDFCVFEGVRGRDRQRELFRARVSRTLDSYHLTGHALDLVPFIGGREQWQIPACIVVAKSMREAARTLDHSITWGAVWDRELASLDPFNLEQEIEAYVERWRARHPTANPDERPLIDYVHFQIDRTTRLPT